MAYLTNWNTSNSFEHTDLQMLGKMNIYSNVNEY